MCRRVARSRARHFLFLVPLGAGVGTVTGAAFQDTLFGLAVGSVLGVLLAVVVTVRTR
jgi:uncharacterized membrane protein